MICPVCGKETEELIEGMCPECFLSKNKPIIDIVKKPIKVCPICGRIKVKNKWVEISKNVLLKVINNRIKINKIYKFKIGISSFKFSESDLNIVLMINIRYGNLNSTRIYRISLPLEKTICDDCKKSSPEYFETIIQIRGNTPNKISDIISYLDRNFEKYKIYVTKVEEKERGVDIYVNNSKIVRKICLKLKKLYKNIEIKITRKLHTLDRQTSKNIYKQTILIRL